MYVGENERLPSPQLLPVATAPEIPQLRFFFRYEFSSPGTYYGNTKSPKSALKDA